MDKNNDKKVSDLCVQLGMDALKVVVSSLIAAGVVAVILAAIATTAVTVPVLLIIAGTIFIGVVIGKVLDFVDTKTGSTEYMKIQTRKGVTFLEGSKNWQQYVAEPMGRLYYQLGNVSERLKYDDPMLWLGHMR